MTEKTSQGKLGLFQVATDKTGKELKGVKKDGTPWTSYKYKIGGRFYSGFKKLSEFEPSVEVGDYVIVAYDEQPNKDPQKKPYKNLINITEAVSQEELDECNKPVNMVDVEATGGYGREEPVSEEERWAKINAVKDQKIQFGMVFKKTIDWIIAERAMKGEGNTYMLDENFSPVFDRLWKHATEKRKEKLE